MIFNRKFKLIAATLSVALLVVAALTVTANNGKGGIDARKHEILSEIDRLSTGNNQIDSTQQFSFMDELLNVESAFTNDEIVDLIKDVSHIDTTKLMLLDLYFHKNSMHPNDSGDLKALLYDDRVSIDVKRKILSDASFNSDDEPLLIDLIQNDADLAGISLKKLSFINSQRAFELSQDILNNRADESRVNISEALKAMARYLKDNQDLPNYEELEADFIAQSSGTDVFAKSDLQSKKAILSIIEDASYGRSEKVFAIDQNYMVLEEILMSNPNDVEIGSVLKAMEICPIIDLIEPLQEAMTTVDDPELLQRADEVIKLMEEEGSPANVKWLD